MTCVYRAENKK